MLDKCKSVKLEFFTLSLMKTLKFKNTYLHYGGISHRHACMRMLTSSISHKSLEQAAA